MVYGALATITSGSPIPLNGSPVDALASAARVPATWVIIQNQIGNADVIVGGANVDYTLLNGIVLQSGDSLMLPDTSVPTPYDLKRTFIDGAAGANGQLVSVVYGRR